MQATPDRIRQDRRLIGQTLFKLSLPRLAILAAGIVIAICIWLYAASWLLDLGPRVGLDWLRFLGPQVSDIIGRIINPYLWWALTAIWTIIVIYALKAWIASSLAAGRLYAVDSAVLAELRPRLCDETVEVLRWVWTDRSEPFTVGDLQRAHQELRGNRIGKIALMRAQSAILGQDGDHAGSHAEAEELPRAARRPVEPTLGRTR
jgi:hypothetical protein